MSGARQPTLKLEQVNTDAPIAEAKKKLPTHVIARELAELAV
jgi:hypothetical protein